MADVIASMVDIIAFDNSSDNKEIVEFQIRKRIVFYYQII